MVTNETSLLPGRLQKLRIVSNCYHHPLTGPQLLTESEAITTFIADPSASLPRALPDIILYRDPKNQRVMNPDQAQNLLLQERSPIVSLLSLTPEETPFPSFPIPLKPLFLIQTTHHPIRN